MYKTCSKCGRIHDYNYKCSKRNYYRNKEVSDFRYNSVWKKKSKEIREKAKYLCEFCRLNNIFNTKKLEVHHIIPLEEDITKGLDNYNLICLCNEHHRKAEQNQINKDILFNIAKQREELNPPDNFPKK